MTEKMRRDFCIECRKETEYLLQKRDMVKTIKDKSYKFEITVAVCMECGREMSIPGLIDKNVQEIDEQYRAMEGLVSMEDIEKLMKIYKIGKAPLALALGFGEVTIPRYLEGQVPSREYSDIIKAALASPAYMKQRLMENRSKLTDAAYKKSMAAADSIERLFNVSDKMLRVIAYVFERLEEVTPLMLQKRCTSFRVFILPCMEGRFLRRTAGHGYMDRFIRKYTICSGILNTIPLMMRVLHC